VGEKTKNRETYDEKRKNADDEEHQVPQETSDKETSKLRKRLLYRGDRWRGKKPPRGMKKKK